MTGISFWNGLNKPSASSVLAAASFGLAALFVLFAVNLALRPLVLPPLEHHVPLPDEEYGNLVPLDNPLKRFPCCILVPSKLPANLTLQKVRMGGIYGTAATALFYSDGLKIIERPQPVHIDISRFTSTHEGFPKMHSFSYGDAKGAGHDPWTITLANGSTIHHRGHLSFWLDGPQWLYELVGEHSFAELREIAISMLQSLEGRPVPDELRGRSVSLSEASEIARKSGFRISLPSKLPDGFELVDVRVAERYVATLENPQLETLVRLVYPETPLPANATSFDLIKSGGFTLTLKKRIVPGEFEGLYRLVKGHEEDTRASRLLTINGSIPECICSYHVWPSAGVSMMNWYDKDMEFQIIASSRRLDFQQLITIAESIR